ncbi:hypothetical protein EMCRGX_G006773 [Ephydatia muelleri]
MMDQVRKYSAQGLTTQFVGEAQEDWSVTARVLHGEYQLLYINPEALLRNRLWKEMLCTTKYRDNLVALVVDEAHCVCDPSELGGKLFAKSIIPQGVVSQASLPHLSQDSQRQTLLDAVMRQEAPHTFQRFVEIILEDETNDYIGEKLKEEYLKKGGQWT